MTLSFIMVCIGREDIKIYFLQISFVKLLLPRNFLLFNIFTDHFLQNKKTFLKSKNFEVKRQIYPECLIKISVRRGPDIIF